MSLVFPAIIAVAAALAVLVAVRADLTRQRGGKILAFVALFLLPPLVLWGSFSAHMERAQSTAFCLSCHVMTDFGRSLYVDDPSYIPAVHFQNNRVPRDRACYACHTDYAMFGTVRAKLRGVRHLSVQYLGTVPRRTVFVSTSRTTTGNAFTATPAPARSRSIPRTSRPLSGSPRSSQTSCRAPRASATTRCTTSRRS